MKRYLPLLLVIILLGTGTYFSLSRGKILGAADGMLNIPSTPCGRMISSALHDEVSKIPDKDEAAIAELRTQAATMSKDNLASFISVDEKFDYRNSIKSILFFGRDFVRMTQIAVKGQSSMDLLNSELLSEWLREDRQSALDSYRGKIILHALELALFAQSKESECASMDQGYSDVSDSLATGILESASSFLNLDASDPSRIPSEKKILERSAQLVQYALNLPFTDAPEVKNDVEKIFYQALDNRFVKVNLTVNLDSNPVLAAPIELDLTTQIATSGGGKGGGSIIEVATRFLRINQGADGPAARLTYIGFISVPNNSYQITFASPTTTVASFITGPEGGAGIRWTLPGVLEAMLNEGQTIAEIQTQAIQSTL